MWLESESHLNIWRAQIVNFNYAQPGEMVFSLPI